MQYRIVSFLILSLLFVSTGFAQFGKNKVQYKDFEWYYIQTDHFDIYFTGEGETLAEFSANEAEVVLDSIQNSFNYKVNNRITLIIYNSQNDFQETNVTDQYLSEGIQGFTELFKNRVVVQFTGSYKQFRHLIHHELVHAVMNDMFYGGSLQNIISNNITLQVPLWFSEGMAEYQALGWDVDTDMFIRDAAISEYLPDIRNLGGYFAYRGGQSVFYYIAKKYGAPKIGELINKVRGTGNVEEGFKSTIGLSIKELNERWKKDIKKTYWPDIAFREDPEEFAKRLTDPEEDGAFYNTSPTLSPQGDKIAFISNRDFYFDVYLMDALDGKIIKKIVEGNRSPDFEELNILTPGLTWSPDGSKIALAAKSGGYDVIYIIDVESEDKEEIDFKLDAVQSVQWSNDGEKLAFIGQDASQSDVFVYNLITKDLVNVTDDIFSDKDPSWSFDDSKIYFASSRDNYLQESEVPSSFKIYEHDYSQSDIYSIDLLSNKITRITDLPHSDESTPVENADGTELIYISDINGINNIYKRSLVLSEEDSVSKISQLDHTPITNSLNGLYQLSTSKDGKKLVFSSLYEAVFNIFMINNPYEPKTELDTLKPTVYITMLHQEREGERVVESIFEEEDLPGEETDSSGIKIFTGDIVDNDAKPDSGVQDYSDFVFGRDPDDQPDRNNNREELFNPQDNLDDDGNFKVNKYKITFGADLVYANAGYSTLYGLLGTTVISFSDVLGNHRLIGVTGLQIDLKNSDYGLAYYYLPERVNLGVEGFHTARFVRLIRGNFTNLFRFRNFGFSASASLPLNRFYRIDAGLSWLNVKGENLDDISEPSEDASFIIPSLSFVHDNVLWGYTAPIEGTRYRFSTFGNPGIANSDLRFVSLLGDYRTYYRFWTDYSFAMRFSGGFSEGPNAQRFFIGGTENWINRTFATTEVPIESASDFAFLTAALPLRGYDYAEQIGTKYALMNFELRFPLIRYLVTGGLPLLFSNIIGTAFIDVGAAWNNTEKFKPFEKDISGDLVTKDMLVGTGFGARVYFLYFLLRIDVAWAYNIEGFSAPKYYFSLGADF